MIILKGIVAIFTAVITLISASGITTVFPHLAVIPDMVKVGADYISLERNGDAPSKKEIKNALAENSGVAHPFVLATDKNFDVARNEYQNGTENEYAAALSKSVVDNADALLDTEVFEGEAKAAMEFLALVNSD